MNTMQRRLNRYAVALPLAFIAGLALIGVALAHHEPWQGTGETVHYDAELSPAVGATENVTDSVDTYDFYCFNVVSGDAVTITSDGPQELGLYQGVFTEGTDDTTLPLS